jgi:hypothetical protein
MAGYLSTNANYLVSVSRGAPSGTNVTSGLSVIANANAKLRISIENRWVNVLEALGIDTEGGGLASSFAAAAQLVSGNNILPLIATSHVWRGSSGIEITLDMRFDAWTDPVADVLNPVETLVAMFSPTRGGGNNSATNTFNTAIGNLANLFNIKGLTGGNFLTPPGPTPFSYAKNGPSDPMLITVQLGRVLTIGGLIPTTLAWEFENRFVTSGDPVCALVSATFISYVVPAVADILAFFTNQTNVYSIQNPSSANTNTTPVQTTNSNVAIPASNVSSIGTVGGLGGN